MAARFLLTGFITLVLGAVMLADEAKKEFQLGPARPFVPRDGPGNVFAKLKAGQDVRMG